MMAEKIQVIMCPVDRPPYVTNISNTLENMQRTVGGYIETVTLDNSSVIICNEEGRLKGLPDNPSLPGYVGDCFICGYEGDVFTDIQEIDKKIILFLVREHYGKNYDTAAVPG